MNIIEISIENIWTVKITFNLLLIILTIILVIFLDKIWKWLKNKTKSLNEITIDEIELGIGSNSKVKLKYDSRDRQIAYKLWVELSTRKIGLEFEKGYDVISEVYDSWYEFFKIARELLKEIPVEKIQDDKETSLVEISIQILNKCIRPHLTKWQAKYRKWYENKIKKNKDKQISPQEIQKEYEYYDEMVEDILNVNKKIKEYSKILYSIAVKG